MNDRYRRIRRATLLGAALSAVAVAAALSPASRAPASLSTVDSTAPAGLAMQLAEPAPGWDPHPLCLCPICTSLREQPLDLPAGEATSATVPIV